MIGKKVPLLIIASTLLTAVLAATYIPNIKSNEAVKAETIVLENLNASELKEYKSELFKKVDSIENVVGWTANDKLLIFKDATESLEGEKILNRVLLEEKSEDGEVYKTHEIKLNMDKYNKNLISDYEMFEPNFIDNVQYMVLLSPDKEKVLISAEIIDVKDLPENQYRVNNKGYSAIYNLKTGEVIFIKDSSRFIKWSSDSSNVFGINYAACYYKHMADPFNQHFFPAYTYRNVLYNIEDNKVEVITEDNALYESLKITKDTYDKILNNPNLKERKRFLLGYTGTEETLEPELRVKKLPFNNNQYNLNYIVDINKDGQYMFIGNDNLIPIFHGFPVIYVGEKGDGEKKKVFETYFLNPYTTITNETNLLYSGIPSSSLKSQSPGTALGLNMYNLESGKDVILYEGQIGSFAHCSKSKTIAIYDDVKKDILIGKLVNDKITDLKSYYKMNTRAFDLHFNHDGSKLYFKGSANDIDGVIYINSGEVVDQSK